jgi:biopolymer transport protein ExbD/biopolymer transport protein TolR
MAAKLSGPGGGSKFVIEQNHEINVTPFVDVMLVLLIIFMVAAPLATVDVEVALPPAAAKATPPPPKPIYVSIKKDGSVYLMNDRLDSTDDLPTAINKMIGKRDPTHERVYIRADKDTQYGDFEDVMKTLQDQGFYSVALVGEDKK